MTKENLEELEQYSEEESDEWEDAILIGYPEVIGNFLIKFSSFENYINKWVSNNINDRSHHPGFQIIQLLIVANKISLLERTTLMLIARSKPELTNDFKDLIKKIRTINTFRNKIVHANWVSLKKNGDVSTKIVIDSDEGTVYFEKNKITPDIILKNIKEMEILIDDLDNFFEKL